MKESKTKKVPKNKVVTKKATLKRSIFKVTEYTNPRWEEIDFYTHCSINKAGLVKARISWQELASIYIDHEKNIESLQSLGNTVSQMLQQNRYVNSTKSRAKEPIKLVRKIVRKRIEGKDINFENYKQKITDLVGVRVLHVLKRDWVYIHSSIIQSFDLKKNSSAIAYINEGDATQWKSFYTENGCKCETSVRNYRSVHYDIEIGFTKQKIILEIQVRTINEEAWGELDHKINYPVPAVKVIGDFIRAANMLSNTADELSQQIISVHQQLTEMKVDQGRLTAERDEALKETRLLLNKLAKTKEEKEQVEKALLDLERVNKSSTINFSPTPTRTSWKIVTDSNTAQPLSFNTTSPSIISGNYITTGVGSAYNITAGATENPTYYLSKCESCESPLTFSDLTNYIGNKCQKCRLKGTISITGVL